MTPIPPKRYYFLLPLLLAGCSQLWIVDEETPQQTGANTTKQAQPVEAETEYYTFAESFEAVLHWLWIGTLEIISLGTYEEIPQVEQAEDAKAQQIAAEEAELDVEEQAPAEEAKAKEFEGDFEPLDEMPISDPYRIESLRERGKYLVEAVAACGFCHGTGPLRSGVELSGGMSMRDEFGEVRAPNITSDVKTGIGAWSVTEIGRAVRSSISRDGHPLGMRMHQGYAWMSDEDAKAIGVYLKSTPPVEREIARREIGSFERRNWGLFSRHQDVKGYVPEFDNKRGMAYGRYLATSVSRCVYCHSPERKMPFVQGSEVRGEAESGAKGWIDWSKLYASADEVDEPTPTPHREPLKLTELGAGQFPVSGPELVDSEESAIKEWTPEQLVAYLSSGSVPRRSTTAAPGAGSGKELCPWPFFKEMTAEDKEAVAKYLIAVSVLKPED